MNIRRSIAAIAVGVMLGGGLLVSPPTAWADNPLHIHFCGPNDNNRCGYGGVTNNKTRIYSCDTYADGVGFRTYARLTGGATTFVDDKNGSKSGCSDKTDLHNVTGYRVVWKGSPWRCKPSCTGWETDF